MPGRLRFFICFVFLTYATSASAYVDPGSTLLLIQGLLAAIGGVLMFVTHPIKTIKAWVARLRGRDDA